MTHDPCTTWNSSPIAPKAPNPQKGAGFISQMFYVEHCRHEPLNLCTTRTACRSTAPYGSLPTVFHVEHQVPARYSLHTAHCGTGSVYKVPRPLYRNRQAQTAETSQHRPASSRLRRVVSRHARSTPAARQEHVRCGFAMFHVEHSEPVLPLTLNSADQAQSFATDVPRGTVPLAPVLF